MSSRKHTPADQEVGYNSYTDFDATAERVRQRLESMYPTERKVKRMVPRAWLLMAASLLLIVSFAWLSFGRPPAYQRLAADYRQHVPADELSPQRSATATAESLPLARVLSDYHNQDYETAIAGWRTLAEGATGEQKNRYNFYKAASEWLAQRPTDAVATLQPLLKEVNPKTPEYRCVQYVLAMAYVDSEALDLAVPLLQDLAVKTDQMGDQARNMLKAIKER